MSIKYIFKYLVLAAAAVSIGLLIFIIILGYKNSLNIGLHILKLDVYKDKIANLVTEQKFIIIKAFFVFTSILFVVIFRFYKIIFEAIGNYTRLFFSSGVRVIKKELSSTAAYIIIVPLIASVYYAISIPVTYDEAWTFINFTHRGFLISLSYYPAPNNHVFHSLITNFTSFIPLISPLFKLRISAILINLLTLIVCSHFLRKYINEKSSLVITAIFSVLFMDIYYSYLSRGYGIIMFCFVSCLYFAFNIIKNGNKTRDWIWFSFFSIIGYFTMPSFLYPFLILNVLIFINTKDVLKKQLFCCAVIFTTVLLLYFPIIIVNGPKALYANKFIVKKDRMTVLLELPSFFASSLESITGFRWYYTVSILLVALIFSFRNKVNTIPYFKFFLLCLIAPSILLIAHSLIPFNRTFNFYGFILVFLIVLPFSIYINKLNINYLLPTLIVLQLLLVYNFNSKINTYESYSIQSKRVTAKIAGNHNYVVNSNLFDAYLLFENETHGFNSFKLKYYPSTKMSCDSVSNADFVVIDKNVDFTTKRKAKFENQYFKVY